MSSRITIPFHEVDTHNIVPVWIASDKREYGARTLRSKVHKHLPEFLREIPAMSKVTVSGQQGHPPLRRL